MNLLCEGLVEIRGLLRYIKIKNHPMLPTPSDFIYTSEDAQSYANILYHLRRQPAIGTYFRLAVIFILKIRIDIEPHTKKG